MGIHRLLTVLKSIEDDVHISEYRGLTVGVDGYAWLHRATASCSRELALGIESSAYVSFFEHRVRLFLHHGVVPLVVFDGANLPAKAATEAARAEARAEALRGAREAIT